MTIVELHMNIDCDGCEENVTKALLKLEGVHYVTVDRLHGKVIVTGSTSQKKVLRAARRTGRLAVLWPSAYNHAYAQPPAAYSYHQPYHAAAHVPQDHHHHYDAGTRSKNGGGGGGVSAVGRRPPAQNYHKASSYNYHVHGYFDSDLYGSYHHEQQPDVVPVAVRSYFSDENPSAAPSCDRLPLIDIALAVPLFVYTCVRSVVATSSFFA
ncbi:hypothetical protein QOZ80_6AG0542230 [Eleusine coracana subsp. coracana]|nr:hypothetical protein QOZ80_6AG0542230 [Eleusine coracana subsp. coracana]